MKKIVTFFVLSLATIALYAVPAKPGCGVWGDEWFHFYGDQLDFATSPTLQALYQQSVRLRPRQEMASNFPKKGEIRSIVLLVNFTDVKFNKTRQDFWNMLNVPGYSENRGTGSARDFFISCSDSAFLPTFDVYGPYQVSHDQQYYGANTKNNSINTARVSEMITEACTKALNDGVNFANYDLNNDGKVDNIFIYYAGYNEADGGGENTIWPHRSVTLSKNKYNGKLIYDYACSSELKTTNGSKRNEMCGIGTFCHEFSHVLGLPDMYHTNDSKIYTVGYWDIMASGSYSNDGRTPPFYTGWERFMLEWDTPVQLLEAGDYVATPTETKGTTYLIAESTHNLKPQNVSPLECWTIENRQHVGWDTPAGALPGTGLLIAHITHNSTTWFGNTYNNASPLGFDVCEAYFQNPTKSTDSDTYPGRQNITTFLPKTNAGVSLRAYQLSNIHEVGNNAVAFHVEAGNSGFRTIPDQIPTITTYVVDNKVYHNPAQKVIIYGTKLAEQTLTIEVESPLFEISLDSINWSNSTFYTNTQGSNYEHSLWIRCNYNIPCKNIQSRLRIYNSIQSYSAIIDAQTIRPTLITAVQPMAASDVSPYSFKARWEAQPDAEVYYLSVFRLLDESSSVEQGFETFSNYDKIAAAGWQANFIKQVTNVHVEGKYGTCFSTTGNSMTSDRYPLPVTHLRFWTGQSYTFGDNSQGKLVVEGQRYDQTWMPIETITMQATSSNRYHEYDFNLADSLICFRFTFTAIYGTEGGIVLDDYRVDMPQTPEYIYSGHDYPIYSNEADIDHLTPNTLYYYQLACAEEKGCERHESLLGSIQEVQTLGGTQSNKRFTIHCLDREHIYAYLPEWGIAGAQLNMYDPAGRLIKTIAIEESTHIIPIPADGLQPNTVYMVKYVSNQKISKNGIWSKFVYR